MKEGEQIRTATVGKWCGLVFLLLLEIQSAFGQGQKADIRPLEPSQTIEREISGKETHRYKFNLKAQEFFQARVEQKSVDVALRLLDAEGNVLAAMDSPNEKEGPETLSFVAAKTGGFVLEVSGFDEEAEKGIYTIRRAVRQRATAQDKRRVEVERLFVEGMTARGTVSQSERAIAKLEESLVGWQELKDDYLVQLTAKQIQQLKASQNQPDVRPLPIGDSVERRLKGGERHFYLVELKQGQFLQIDVQGKSIDVILAFGLKSDRQPMAYANFGFGSDADRETLTVAVEKGGSYAVLVDTPPTSLSGGYQLTAQIKDAATAADKKRIEAGRLLAEGLTRANKRTGGDFQESLTQLEESLALWQELKEDYWAQLTATRIQQIKLFHNPLDSIKRLPVGETIEGQLKGGEIQQYGFNLEQGQVLRADLEERDIDVFVGLSKFPDKAPMALSNFGAGNDRETLTIIAEKAGLYALLVFSRALPVSGSYQLTAQIKNEATAADRERIEAERLLAEGAARVKKQTESDSLEGVKRLEEALLLWKKSGEKYWEAYTYSRLGAIYNNLGENQKALNCFNQSLALRRGLGDTRGEAITLSNIGLVYSDVGEHQEALNYLNLSLSLKTAFNDATGKAITLNNIGRVYADLGKTKEAIDSFDKALALLSKDPSKYLEAGILNNIGGTYLSTGDLQKALASFDKALTLLKEIGDKSRKAATLNNIGLAYSRLGEKRKALDYYNQALPIVKASGDKHGEASTLNNMMGVWESLGAKRLALFYGKLSVNRFQQLRGSMQGLNSATQKSFLRTIKSPYQYLIEMLIDERQFESAVQVLNLYQDQQFFDFNRDTHSSVRQTALSLREEEFINRYETISERVGQIGAQVEELKRQKNLRQLSETELAQLQKLEADLQTASDEFLVLLSDAAGEFTGTPDAKDKVPAIRDVTEMQAALRELGATTKQKTVALYTFIGRDAFYIVLISPDGEATAFKSLISGDELNKKILEFHAILQATVYDTRLLGKELYELIFKPVEAKLKEMNAQTLMWLLDGTLRYIPIAALWDGEKYLVERFQNVAFTRTNQERMTQAVSSDWTGYGFNNSEPHKVEFLGATLEFDPLAFGKNEMEIFRTATNPKGFVAGTVFSEAQFNKDSLMAALKQHRPLVHISSHFRFYPGDDTRSFLLLGDGKILTMAEMKEHANLFRGVELLTLSACDTAAQLPDANGREIDGFAELAQRLGAGSVMASLWQVIDRSTAQLMNGFYKNRQKGRLNKAEALRKAQLALLYGRTEASALSSTAKKSPTAAQRNETTRRDSSKGEDIFIEEKYRVPFTADENKPFAHPYYWAPFVLFGNWK